MKFLIITLSLLCSSVCSPNLYHNPLMDKTYIYTNSAAISYRDSQKFCAQNSATLLKIESEREHFWIKSKISPKFPIVLNINATAKNTSPTQWSDGSPILWTNWAKNEPEVNSTFQFFAVNFFQYSQGFWGSLDLLAWENATIFHVICERQFDFVKLEHLAEIRQKLDKVLAHLASVNCSCDNKN